MSRLDELNMQVTTAIIEVEVAQRKLSRIEEEIASLTSPSSMEGRIARMGAMRAAIEGKERPRAKMLFNLYMAEADADLRKRIREIIQS